MIGYCVLSPAMRDGSRVGTFKFWTLDRARAEAEVARAHGRELHEVAFADAPAAVREAWEREAARAE